MVLCEMKVRCLRHFMLITLVFFFIDVRKTEPSVISVPRFKSYLCVETVVSCILWFLNLNLNLNFDLYLFYFLIYNYKNCLPLQLVVPDLIEAGQKF